MASGGGRETDWLRTRGRVAVACVGQRTSIRIHWFAFPFVVSTSRRRRRRPAAVGFPVLPALSEDHASGLPPFVTCQVPPSLLSRGSPSAASTVLDGLVPRGGLVYWWKTLARLDCSELYHGDQANGCFACCPSWWGSSICKDWRCDESCWRCKGSMVLSADHSVYLGCKAAASTSRVAVAFFSSPMEQIQKSLANVVFNLLFASEILGLLDYSAVLKLLQLPLDDQINQGYVTKLMPADIMESAMTTLAASDGCTPSKYTKSLAFRHIPAIAGLQRRT
ncbi:hypothetical protein GUJ93_ZPchr0012g20739 [Zizania palustris]|uniref:Uncharacterized protein n=1 Tax=Zizania palustris TaxID=103762 RepID=A0A8J6BV85_ZIZPA|nr:hypothetical protein GUJ93_ZPchr0012g20739 [Zizania palustris]